MTKILYSVLILIIFPSLVFSSEGNIQPCTTSPYTIKYSTKTDKLYVGCNWNNECFNSKIIDPITLSIEKSFDLPGCIENIVPVNNGLSLLILLSGIDGDSDTEEGELRLINSQDGSTLNYYSFSNTCPYSCVIDNNENYVYITAGTKDLLTTKVTKIDLNNHPFKIVGSEPEIGMFGFDIAITDDNEKVYVIDNWLYPGEEPDYEDFRKLHVFDTNGDSSLITLPYVKINGAIASLEMGCDNLMYGFNPIPDPGEPSLYIIDTTDDTFTTKRYGDTGLKFASLDRINSKLYCSTLEKYLLEFPSEYEAYSFRESNEIMIIDLTDYSSEMVQINGNPIWLIEAVPLDDPVFECRVFTTSQPVSPDIHYIDIPR